jgi:hypothetical protein
MEQLKPSNQLCFPFHETMKFARFVCQYLNASAPIYRGLARGHMVEHKPFGEGTAIKQADGAYLGKQNYLPKPISLIVCAVFAQINLYLFTTPLSDMTSANLTLPLRQL